MKTNFSLLFYLKKQKNYVSGNVPIYMSVHFGECDSSSLLVKI